MNLRDFSFPVVERPVYADNGLADLIDPGNDNTFLKGDYKAIVREDKNQLISIVRQSYKVVPNEVLISQLTQQLDLVDTSYEIDPSHSFVENNRMRLQIRFPEILINDGESDIALSIYLHNSYNMSESVRIFFGAIRGICSNGMVFGKVLGQFYKKHTKGFQIGDLKKEISAVYDCLPKIENRIKQLDSRPVTDGIRENVQKELGKKVSQEVLDRSHQSQWALYNAITHLVSHVIQQRYRSRYQIAAAKVFGL
ncbi:MAG: DUF932 domain-containing protein [candidate division Zixibacteria bacterium]|nr:DUF932 domain-containing protein [candidate division Zixibacteria bacterium]